MSTADYLDDLTTNGLVFNVSTLSSPRDTIKQLLVFGAFVIGIGLIGTFMNGVVLSVLLSKKLRTKATYLLIINQVVLDFLSCLFLLPCYIVKMRNVYLSGDWGRFVCIVFFWDMSVFSLQAGSITNLVLIAAERYLKIVHSVFHIKYFKRWMLFVGLISVWLTVIFLNLYYVWTIDIVDGTCYSIYAASRGGFYLAYGAFIMAWEFVIPLVLFLNLYGRILLFVRQRNKTLTGNNTNQVTATSLQTNAQRSQMNVTITMILVSSAFVIYWFPNQLFCLLTYINNYYGLDEVYYATVFLIFLNVCTNPLIYAAKHEEVRNRLKKWFFKNKVQPDISIIFR